MIKIKEIIIVEGKHDKIKLKQFLDANIIETNGFRIFSDKNKQKMIVNLAKKQGIIILTDSDSAGFVIRSFLKSILPKDVVIKNAYIPQILGKEKRKSQASKEGFLGVEGLVEDEIKKALENVMTLSDKKVEIITKSDFFIAGLTGNENSSQKREKLLKKLDLPLCMSTNALLEYVNIALSIEEFANLLQEID